MHLLVHNSVENNSIKGELESSLYVALEGTPKIFFQGALKIAQNSEEKDTFDDIIDGLLDSAIDGALEDAPNDPLNDLPKDAQEAITFESKQNVVNVLNFQLLSIMFNLSMMQAISRGSVA